MSKILGFDISSETLAYSLLEYDKITKKIKLLLVDYIKPCKNGSIIERLADTRDKILNIIESTCPDMIAIEDIIQFIKGASTAQTIITLTSFNRMIGLLSYDFLGKAPALLNIMSIRHCIKRQAKLIVLPKKEDLPVILESLLDVKFPYEYNKKGKIKKESFDKSDAICCAYCYIINMEIKDDNIKTRKMVGV